jgi:hypothetical protein
VALPYRRIAKWLAAWIVCLLVIGVGVGFAYLPRSCAGAAADHYLRNSAVVADRVGQVVKTTPRPYGYSIAFDGNKLRIVMTVTASGRQGEVKVRIATSSADGEALIETAEILSSPRALLPTASFACPHE